MDVSTLVTIIVILKFEALWLFIFYKYVYRAYFPKTPEK